MQKNLFSSPLKKIEKTLLHIKQSVYFNSTSIYRRIHNGTGFVTAGLTATQITTAKSNNAKDLNIDDRISKFQSQLKDEYVYRIPLKYYSDIAKINFSVKIDFSIKCHLETEMKKVFESKKVLASTASIPTTDVKIIFTKAPFIQYEQLLLNKNYRQCLETIMVSKKVLRMGAREILILKTYEINIGTDSININFLDANRRFDWIELSLVYDKSNKHTTIYDSYNVELAAKARKSVKLPNFTNVYSLTNKKISHRQLDTKIFVIQTKLLHVAPLTDYINNPIFQELIDEDKCFETKSNERIYLDLRASSGYTNEAEKLERNNSKINYLFYSKQLQ